MKINLGSHNKRIEGFVNVDGLDLPNVDVIHDLTLFPYPFEDNSAEEIYICEVLEHISFRKTAFVLRECKRILAHGGKLTVQVPDIGAMCEMYAHDQICDCVPRKAKKYSDYTANARCCSCRGRALIHPERWRFAFSGAQKHEFDAHLNHFTKDILMNDLVSAGFTDIEFTDNIYKLVVIATKKSLL
jgi:ubiquinone/menaquinone biosynthesis C-methylase UbiE